MKRILITGAAGLLGSSITRRLVDEGYELVVLYRQHQLPIEGIRWLQTDLERFSESIWEKVGEVDVVIHNAASKLRGETSAEREVLQRVNVDFSRVLVDWCSQTSVRQIVFTSSLSLLERPLPSLITETATVNRNPVLYYSQTKLKAEQMIAESSASGIKVVILRVSSPVDPSGKTLPDTVLKAWIKKATRGESLTVFGTGQRTQDFVSTTDFAAAVAAVLKRDVDGLFNIASGSPLSMLDLAYLIAKHFGVEVHTEGTDPLEQEQWNISIEKAQREFNYSPKYSGEGLIRELLNHVRL